VKHRDKHGWSEEEAEVSPLRSDVAPEEEGPGELSPPICVVDDDACVREAVGNLLRSAGLQVETFSSAHEFLARRGTDVPGCLVLDVNLPGLSGLDLQQELAKANLQVPIVFLTGHGDIPMSVRAMKAGALEFLTKPVDDEDLLRAIQQGISRQRVRRQRQQVAEQNLSQIVGQSSSLKKVLYQIHMVAPTDTTVLITGESGTGKELVARAIHDSSPRRNEPLVTVNCASVPRELFESEFFGHTKGAFTGAVRDRIGRFQLADKGTIFLDEVGEIPLELQSKLLRVLQQGEFERIGDDHPRQVDARIIAATNRDLNEEVEAGRFRKDLFFRLCVFPIHVPPLRERMEDIPQLAAHLLEAAARRLNFREVELTEEALELLSAYDWPGNIRELQNVIERALIVTQCGPLRVDLVLREERRKLQAQAEPEEKEFAEESEVTVLSQGEMERRKRANLLAALNKAQWKIYGPGGAAEILGVKPTTLASHIKKLGIKRPTP
jgi:DNA-binding NtrC family response regulator